MELIYILEKYNANRASSNSSPKGYGKHFVDLFDIFFIIIIFFQDPKC